MAPSKMVNSPIKIQRRSPYLMDISSPIRDFYNDRHVLVTGGNSMVGMAIVEKLVRDMGRVGRIYVLIGGDKQNTAEQQFGNLLKSAVFNRIRELNLTHRLRKVMLMKGEVTKSNLGLSHQDYLLLAERVHIVIHAATTTNFLSSFKAAILTNVGGTRNVLELCHRLPLLISFLHISSTYCHGLANHVLEQLYAAPGNANRILSLAHVLSESDMKSLEPALLGKHPNACTFSLHLAEHEVARHQNAFPCSIIRPSIVTSAWREPMPGWTTLDATVQIMMAGMHVGVVRRLPLNQRTIVDIIPVDIVVNALLVAVFRAHIIRGCDSPQPMQIYQVCTSTYRPFRYGMLEGGFNQALGSYPLQDSMWFPQVRIVKSLSHFRLAAVFYHFLPSLLLDLIGMASGYKWTFLRLQLLVWQHIHAVHPFTVQEWQFDCRNFLLLSRTLDMADRVIFSMNIQNLDWNEYYINAVIGVREFMCKETIHNVIGARRRYMLLSWIHAALKMLVLYGFFNMLLMCFHLPCEWAGVLIFCLAWVFNEL